MSDHASETTTRLAIKWLMYQHGMTVERATETLTGICSEHSRMGLKRQEALDVANFITDIVDVSNGK